jgi:hypothetical protein
MFYLLSTDCYYLLGWLTCVHHIFLAAVVNSHNLLSCSYIWLNWRSEFSTEKNPTFYSSHHDRHNCSQLELNVHWKSFFARILAFSPWGWAATHSTCKVLGHYYWSQSELALWIFFICIVDLLLYKLILYAWCKFEIWLTFYIYVNKFLSTGTCDL